jgi:D-glycero-alpha-D-manno-heptose-7-phosphate kinase
MPHMKQAIKQTISRTPVRISFFGGGSDYPGYYQRHPGAILGTTINKYTYVSVNTLSDFFDHKIRIGYSKTELVKEIEEIEHPSIRECLRFLDERSNLDIHIFSDLPARTGLGSSSSFTVGFLNALYALKGMRMSKQKLAETACYVEQQLIQENVGSQDQFHSSFGGFNIMEFSQTGIRVRPVIITPEKIRFLESHLMVFYTGLTRHASEIVKEQVQKTAQKTNDPYLHQMVELVYEAEEIITHASKEEMVVKLGSLLDKGWELKKQLSNQITNSIIDNAYALAKNAGAYGGKLCGAGSGGFLALLVKPALHDQVKQALQGFLQVDLRFESTGSTIIYMQD